MSELGKAGFSLLVDESRDASVKEQMAVMVRLVVCYYTFRNSVIMLSQLT